MFNKKNVLCAIIAGLAGLWVATNASATGIGAYVGGQLGDGFTHQGGISISDMNRDLGALMAVSNNHILSNTARDSGLAGRLFGGYQFSPNWAAELGYTKFSNATADRVFSSTSTTTPLHPNIDSHSTIKTYAVDLVGKGILPLPHNFSLYGKLGVAYLSEIENQTGSTTISGVSSVATFHNSEHKIYPTYGVGVSYDVTQNIATDLSWTRIQRVNGDRYLSNTDLLGLGLSYHFS